MNLHYSKRHLINLLVVAAAVGANAFVAWAQIGAQREIDQRAAQAARVRHDLERFRDALDSGLAALGRIEVDGVTESPGAREARAAELDDTAQALRAELARDPAFAQRFENVAAQAARLAREIDETLARAEERLADARVQASAEQATAEQEALAGQGGSAASGAVREAGLSGAAGLDAGVQAHGREFSSPYSGKAGVSGHNLAEPYANKPAVSTSNLSEPYASDRTVAGTAAPPAVAQTVQPDDAPPRAMDPAPAGVASWITNEYIRLDARVDRVDVTLSALQGEQDRALAGAFADSSSAGRRASILLIVTMLSGAALLIYTFGVRENAAREKLRALAGMRARNERFQGLFDAHPVPMYAFDRETLRFLAVNAAAIQQYGYSEEEFLAMTIRDIRPADDITRLEQHLSRSDTLTQNVRTMAGIWRHVRRDGSLISADISHHSLVFQGRAAVFVLADDVTEQIKAEVEAQRSNQMLETVIDNIPQRIFWKDAQSRYLG
ncbi:MAG TPA: PAS domain S-box protein, partial [Paraburkholderia sp.]|nr:PAS domain S-box protein [Paraburkholderia sp.]